LSYKKLLGFLLPGLALLFIAARAFGGDASAQTPVADETPRPTATPAGPVVITLNPTSRALSCSTSTVVTINVTQGGNAVPNGTSITIGSNPGTVAPAIVATNNGSATFTYFAPAAGGGIATISASTLGTTGSVQISLFCGIGPGGGQVPGATLGTPVVQCFGGQANVTFTWTPIAGAEVQFVDLSLLNNGFAGGTFIGFGPLTGTTTTIQWNGLVAGQTHFWRVSAGLPGVGWVFSNTGSFTPCGPQAPAGGTTYTCTGGGRATVTWNIVPPGFTPVATYVDITIFDNGFLPGTFIGQNATGQQNFNWSGILANTPHYWRVNHLGPAGWVSGGLGSFNAAC
jgi:hypothetical protein